MRYTEDERGSFQEIFKQGLTPWIKPVQWNVSRSASGVVRGMHGQKNKPQAKYITVLEGHVVDVVIDLNTMHMDTIELRADGNSLFVPDHCLHGFWCIKPSTILYGVSQEWDRNDEIGISPLDPDFDFPWKNGYDIIVSEKDRNWNLNS